MARLIKAKSLKARKFHYCRNCGTEIAAPGEFYRRETYVYDGSVYNWTTCDECEKIIHDVHMWCGWPEEGIGREEFYEWAIDQENDDMYGEYAKSYLARVKNAKEQYNLRKAK